MWSKILFKPLNDTTNLNFKTHTLLISQFFGRFEASFCTRASRNHSIDTVIIYGSLIEIPDFLHLEVFLFQANPFFNNQLKAHIKNALFFPIIITGIIMVFFQYITQIPPTPIKIFFASVNQFFPLTDGLFIWIIIVHFSIAPTTENAKLTSMTADTYSYFWGSSRKLGMACGDSDLN